MNDFLSGTTIIPIGEKPWSSRALSKIAALSCAGVLSVSASVSAQNMSTLVAGFGPLVGSTTLQVDENYIAAELADKEFPLVELGAMDSSEGESKSEFLLRVGAVLHNFTGRTGHEACSAIMQSQSSNESSNESPSYRVRLITNRSQVSCLRVMFDEDGFKYTGETIHSHPFSHNHNKDSYKDHDLRANRADQRLAGFTCGIRMTISDGTFSPRDMANGGGYLVARGKLLYSNASQVVEVGLINTKAALPSLNVGGPNMINQHAQHAAQAVWADSNSEVLPTIKCRTPVSGPTLRPQPIERSKDVVFK